MARNPFFVLAAASALLWTGCGGGGGGTSLTTPTTSIDADLAQSPAPDAAYHKIPSNDLGAVVSGANVTFNYWNPTASTVAVNLYANWNDSLGSPAATVSLSKGANAIWTSGSIPIPAQKYYVYNVGGTYVLDAYAKSMAQWVHTGKASIPGDTKGKGAILDPAGPLPDGGWVPYAGTSSYFDGSAMKAPNGSTAPYGYASARDAIIYEAGVRDLTVDPAVTRFASGHAWGTFKGLVDMLPHIQKLGVTHVQLLCPLQNYNYDQTAVGTRELDPSVTSGANYNWGYDPQNYFTPSGMYSASPSTPAARISELKTLVNEIHKAGMGVILDVVYNHTANTSVLGDLSGTNYYYRTTSRNGAGSQDVMSEHKMVRKLIVDSVKHWVNTYHVDGFRFDLMGVMDTGTIKAAYAEAAAANPKTLFVGEGWTGFYTGAAADYNGDAIAGADQGNASAFAGMNIGMFSDSYRQIFKNGYPNDGATAFLTGAGQAIADLYSNASGKPSKMSNGFTFVAPSTNNVVNYLTCHDNLCYYDVLACATNAARSQDATILQRAKVGYATLLTSQGIAFLHAGDEMFRTKETTAGKGAQNTKSSTIRTFVDNSYNASDAVNMVAWSNVYAGDPITGAFANYATAQDGYKLYAYTQGLIALRKATNAFRLPDAYLAANLASIAPAGAGSTVLAFGYKAVSTDLTGTYYVFHNADTSPQTFTADVSLAGATLIVDGNSAGVTAIASSTTVTVSGASVTLAPLSSAVFRF
ncbi:alpha-amylase family glycosyl hydrolase [Geothrix sp. 21YS21S-2]|uniref:alpha-amylase family glycosyl hydrolase n=1 Tax=Geothrix sp. 21YS21S-2 TaxID=3068893 RepID=UPI0027B8BA96|nr:alpha-amylase family glycosyl hydrolase [Geothrix sp. 21YS21S-2]